MAGTSFVTAASSFDYLIVKYSSDGQQRWVRRYGDENGKNDRPAAGATDSDDNFYVTGASASDYVTVKYGARGARKWVRRFSPEYYGDGAPTSIATDAQNNIYVLGRTITDWSGALVLVKYSPTGTLLWTGRVDGFARYGTAAADVVVRGTNVYISGSLSRRTIAQNWPYHADMVVAKFGSGGARKWVRYVDGAARELNDTGTALAVNKKGEVFLSGDSWKTLEGGLSAVTVKYSPTGSRVWTNYYDGPSEYSEVRAATTDADNNVVVAAQSMGPAFSGDDDYVVIKYAR